MESRKRFGVLLCAEDSEYVLKKYGGYFQVFVRMLGEEQEQGGEIWELFRAAKGEFPAEDDIGSYDGFVITGSCNDAHGDDPWIHKLITLLRNLASINKKLLGICFGHQILGRALGGKIGRATSGWDIGITTVHLSPSYKPFSSLKIPTALLVIECHRDEIHELPTKAEVIGRSDRTKIEMFRYGDHILGIQGHPEYTKDILLHLIDRLVQRKLITDNYGEEVKGNVEEGDADREAWKRLCINFFKGRM